LRLLGCLISVRQGYCDGRLFETELTVTFIYLSCGLQKMKFFFILLNVFIMQGCMTATPTMKNAIDVTQPDLKHLNRKEFIAAGYNKTYGLCTDYFDALIRAKNNTAFFGESIAAAGNAATTIMGLAKAYSPAIGMVSAGFGAISSALFDFDKDELMTPYPDETKGLILKALEEFSNANPPMQTQTDGEAINRVLQYTEMCTYSGISRFAKVTLAKGTPGCKKANGEPQDCQAQKVITDISPAPIAATKDTSKSIGVNQTASKAAEIAVVNASSANSTPEVIGNEAKDAAIKNGATSLQAEAIGASATGAASSSNAKVAADNAINTFTIAPPLAIKAASEAIKDIPSSNPDVMGNAAKDAAISNGASPLQAEAIGASATGAAKGANTPDIQKGIDNQKIIMISP